MYFCFHANKTCRELIDFYFSFPIPSLLVGLFAFVQTSQTGSSEAAKVLNNLALEKRCESLLIIYVPHLELWPIQRGA